MISFSVADGRVWMRNYQVMIPLDKKRPTEEEMSLVEVGPRACLNPVKIFAGSFGGATVYENPEYVSPNAVRSMMRKKQGGKYATKVKAKQRRKQTLKNAEMEPSFYTHNNAFKM